MGTTLPKKQHYIFAYICSNGFILLPEYMCFLFDSHVSCVMSVWQMEPISSKPLIHSALTPLHQDLDPLFPTNSATNGNSPHQPYLHQPGFAQEFRHSPKSGDDFQCNSNDLVEAVKRSSCNEAMNWETQLGISLLAQSPKKLDTMKHI